MYISEAPKLGELAKCAHKVKVCGTTVQKLHGTSHSLPSMGAAGKVGILLSIMAALPRWSSTPSRDQVWLMASPSSCPLCLARAEASFFTWASATSCQKCAFCAHKLDLHHSQGLRLKLDMS